MGPKKTKKEKVKPAEKVKDKNVTCGELKTATPRTTRSRNKEGDSSQRSVSDFVTSTPRRQRKKDFKENLEKFEHLNITFVKEGPFQSVPDLSIGNEDCPLQLASKSLSMEGLNKIGEELNINICPMGNVCPESSQRDSVTTTSMSLSANILNGQSTGTHVHSTGNVVTKTTSHAVYVNSAELSYTTTSVSTYLHQSGANPTVLAPSTSIAVASQQMLLQSQHGLSGTPYPAHISGSQSLPVQRQLFPSYQQGHQQYPVQQKMVVPMFGSAVSQDVMQNFHLMTTINQNLEAIKADINSYKKTSTENASAIEGIKFVQQQDREVIASMHDQLIQNSQQIKTLSSIVIKLEDQLRIQKDKETAMNAKAWKHTMKIRGYNSEKHPDPQEAVTDFLTQKLSLTGASEVAVKKSYWKGKWIHFELADLADKGVIFKNLKKLRGVKAESGRKFQFEEHLPENMKEDKQCEKQIKYINKQQPDGQKVDISFKKGKLHINNNLHRRKIEVINARVLLELTPEDYSKLETAHMCLSESTTEEDSHFTCYGAEVTNLDQVVDCYKHLKSSMEMPLMSLWPTASRGKM